LAGTETTVYIRPGHVLQYHPDSGAALTRRDLAVRDQEVALP
jgi:iron(III) transport system ATP-binding protein